jgi:hypothetical protein
MADSRIMASLASTELRVDDWTLRCLFNRAKLYQRGKANEFLVIEEKKPRNPTDGFPYPFYALCYYYDRNANVEIARTHFLLADGVTIGASGSTDPKRLYLNGIHYRQLKGPNIARDPSLRFRKGTFCHWAYVFWSRVVKCLLFHR